MSTLLNRLLNHDSYQVPAAAADPGEEVFDAPTATAQTSDSADPVIIRLRNIITPFTRDPEKDSVIHKMLMYRAGKGDVKDQVEHYASRIILPQVIATMLSDSNDFMSYFTSRMVMSHPAALDFSEEFHNSVVEGGLRDQQYLILGGAFNTKVEKKSDLPRIFKKLVAYHPQVGPLLMEALGGAGLSM